MVQRSFEPALEKHPERREEFVTTSSQKVERLYTSLDTSDIDFENDISFSWAVSLHSRHSFNDVQRKIMDYENVCRLWFCRGN